MAIFKKKNFRLEDENGKTPVKFSENKSRLDAVTKAKKKKKTKRIVISLIVFSIIGALGFFGFKGYQAIKNMFEGDSGLLSLISGSPYKPLKGEADGRVNVLLLGVGDESHQAATLSDTIIIASLDTKNNAAAMFSIPRDLYVKIPTNGYAKINAAHAYGEQYNYPGGGPALAKKTIEENLKIPIHYYARVDFSGLAKIVDSLGGVTVDVDKSFCDYNYPVERKGDTRKVCFNAGVQTMNGTKALQYSRSRHALGSEGSDFARSKRQQKVIVAIKEKALSANTVFNPKKVLDIMTALGNHIKTDMQVGELARAYELTKKVEKEKIISRNFDNSADGLLVSASSAAGYILKPKSGDFSDLTEAIKNVFAAMGVRNEKASIELLNGTWNNYLFGLLEDELEEDGYVVSKTGNAEKRNYYKTEIIDYSGGKYPETIKALENKFDVTVQRSSTGTGFGIRVIMAKDYRG